MDIIFEPQRGRPFSIEIGYFDTVQEIKEKVQKYHSIPLDGQTLVFNGQVLQDDCDVEFCQLLHNSRVQLLVAPEPAPSPPSSSSPEPNKPVQPVRVKPESPSSSDTNHMIHLRITIPSMSKNLVPLEMDHNDTVLRLKEKILQELHPIPMGRLIVLSGESELHDNRSLRECDLVDNAEIEVNVRRSPTGSGPTAAMGSNSRKLKVMVLTKCGTKIPVEVNAAENVSELRKELQKLHGGSFQFHLPPEGYFFIYKQNVMDDDRSFRWHHVGHGDTIEIFNGSVTGGS